jgi:hypothetical protein
MSVVSYKKDPDAVLDYLLDWSDWLVNDTIATSTWSSDSGITVDSDSNTTTTTTVWLSGGTAGTDYIVTNHVVTAGAREDDRSIKIRCQER